jgi:hypothetical protein
MRFLRTLLIGLLTLTTGCATLTREECLYGDWFGVGLKDGREGEDASRFINHQDACRQYNVIPDKQQYLAGREQGLQQYCQLDNAIELGLRGVRYQSVCPSDLDKSFRYYNNTAYQVYQQQEALKSLDSSLSEKEHALQDKKLSHKERQNIRNEIRDLDSKRLRLRDDLHAAEVQLDRLMEELRNLH